MRPAGRCSGVRRCCRDRVVAASWSTSCGDQSPHTVAGGLGLRVRLRRAKPHLRLSVVAGHPGRLGGPVQLGPGEGTADPGCAASSPPARGRRHRRPRRWILSASPSGVPRSIQRSRSARVSALRISGQPRTARWPRKSRRRDRAAPRAARASPSPAAAPRDPPPPQPPAGPPAGPHNLDAARQLGKSVVSRQRFRR